MRDDPSCPEPGQSSLEKSVTPLRIFVSYGHDANEELVHLIKTDLEMRGHDVWFDKNENKFGDDWRRACPDLAKASSPPTSRTSTDPARSGATSMPMRCTANTALFC